MQIVFLKIVLLIICNYLFLKLFIIYVQIPQEIHYGIIIIIYNKINYFLMHHYVIHCLLLIEFLISKKARKQDFILIKMNNCNKQLSRMIIKFCIEMFLKCKPNGKSFFFITQSIFFLFYQIIEFWLSLLAKICIFYS